mgnify:CR=1 FL=1
MAQEKKYIPELRFPEFKNDGEWNSDTMENIFEIRNGYTPSKSNPEYWEGGTIPWFRMEDIRTNGHVLSDSIQHITPLGVKGSGLFPAYSIIVATTATIGEHALIIVDSLANQQFTFLTKRKSFEDKLDMLYFHYYMFIIDEWCKKNTNAGGLLSVNMDSFKKLTIPYPPSLSEQRKIAECFVSLDKQIDFTKKKLEQLKEHKKGLMQRLFPYNGKTMPDIRFPEFYDEVAWTITKNDCVIKTITPPKKLSSSEYKVNGKYPIVDQSINFIAGYSDDETAVVHNEDNDYVVFGDHTCILKRVNFPFIQGADGVKIFTSKYSDLLTLYIYQYMCAHPIMSKEYKRHFSDLREQEFIYPKKMEEQEKIAQSLLSLDEIILAYENKVSTMERHKKALMQQLFPQL